MEKLLAGKRMELGMLDNLSKYKIILASNSPRRKELMTGLGIKYSVKTLPDIDESYPETLVGGEIPVYIAKGKADAAPQSRRPRLSPDR